MVSEGNIGSLERRKRLGMGLVMIGGGVALAAVLYWAQASRWWGLGLFPPFWLGALGIFQALEKT